MLGSLFKVLPKVEVPPEWGVDPVPPSERRMTFRQHFVLWFNLGVGLLVILTGALLVLPEGLGMAPRQALLAVIVGSIIGVFLLSLMAYAGARVHVPTMVLLRPVLGIRGSYVPSFFNFLQLVGWTAFELWAMSWAANHVAKTMFGFDAYLLWLVIFAIICTSFALGGPIVVVRQWMEKFGIWVMTAASLWLTYSIVSSFNLGDVLSQTSTNGAPFWVGVDLVIAMPISWIPLIADYSRFGRSDRGALAGAGLGYLLANTWFYGLGVLLVATVTLGDLSNPAVAIAGAIIVFTAGWLALLATLAVETDQAFADIYSAAVTAQNVFSRIPQRVFIVIVAAIGLVLASFLNMVTYEIFMLLIGSIFISLFGVMAADYFVVRRQEYETVPLYERDGAYWYLGGVNWLALICWATGVIVYHSVNTNLLSNFAFMGSLVSQIRDVVPSAFTSYGGSLPSFIVAFVLYAVLSPLLLRRNEDEEL